MHVRAAHSQRVFYRCLRSRLACRRPRGCMSILPYPHPVWKTSDESQALSHTGFHSAALPDLPPARLLAWRYSSRSARCGKPSPRCTSRKKRLKSLPRTRRRHCLSSLRSLYPRSKRPPAPYPRLLLVARSDPLLRQSALARPAARRLLAIRVGRGNRVCRAGGAGGTQPATSADGTRSVPATPDRWHPGRSRNRATLFWSHRGPVHLTSLVDRFIFPASRIAHLSSIE